MLNDEKEAKEVFNKILSGAQKVDDDISMDIFKNIFNLIDFSRQLLRLSNNETFTNFLKCDKTKKMFCEAVFDSNDLSFAKSVIIKFRNVSTRLNDMLADNTYVAEEIKAIIERASRNEPDLQVDILQTAKAFLKQYLAIFMKEPGKYDQTYSIIKSIFEKIKKPQNLMIYPFLYDFLVSGAQDFTLTHRDFSDIIIKSQKINREALPFILDLYRSKRFSDTLSEFLQMHFITFLSFMLSPQSSLTDAMIVSEFLEEEIVNNRVDKIAIKIIDQNYDSLSHVMKLKVIKLFEVIPRNFKKLIFGDKLDGKNVRIGLEIIQTLENTKKLIKVEDDLRELLGRYDSFEKYLADLKEKKENMNDNLLLNPCVIRLLEKFPDLAKKWPDFEDFLKEYQGEKIVPTSKPRSSGSLSLYMLSSQRRQRP